MYVVFICSVKIHLIIELTVILCDLATPNTHIKPNFVQISFLILIILYFQISIVWLLKAALSIISQVLIHKLLIIGLVRLK